MSFPFNHPRDAASQRFIAKGIARLSSAPLVDEMLIFNLSTNARRLPLVEDPSPLAAAEDRRRFLKSCGRFAVTVPPAITVLLSTSLSSEAIAASSGGGGGGGHGGGPKGNNGVGNGPDPQPPGNPKINDGPGTGPGHPGRRH